MKIEITMDVLKTTALVLAVIFIANALPISKSNSSEDLMEDEWRTLQPSDKRSIALLQD